jgi:hypothetical protein
MGIGITSAFGPKLLGRSSGKCPVAFDPMRKSPPLNDILFDKLPDVFQVSSLHC